MKASVEAPGRSGLAGLVLVSQVLEIPFHPRRARNLEYVVITWENGSRSGAGSGVPRTGENPRSFGLRLCRVRMSIMIWYEIAGDWKHFTEKVKAKWGKLTDADLTTFSGKREQLSSLLQRKYGYARDEAEREINDFSGDAKVSP